MTSESTMLAASGQHGARTFSHRLIDLSRDVAERAAFRLRGPRIGYIGSARSQNVGDRAVFDAFRGVLHRSHVLPIGSARRESTLTKLGLSGERYLSGVVLGGGTMINEYSLDTVRAFLAAGVDVRAVGTGVGCAGWEQEREVDLGEWPAVLAQFSRVGIRGPRSLQTLQKLGVTNAHVIGDLALARTRRFADVAREERTVLWNAIGGSKHARWNPEALEAARQWVKELADDRWRVIPFAMHPNDLVTLRAELAQIGLSHLRPWLPESSEAFIDAAQRATLVLSMRLHGAVLGVAGGAAVVSLSYLDKCHDFMDSVGLEDACFELEAGGDLASRKAALERSVRCAIDGRLRAHARALELRERIEEEGRILEARVLAT